MLEVKKLVSGLAQINLNVTDPNVSVCVCVFATVFFSLYFINPIKMPNTTDINAQLAMYSYT